MSDGRSRSVSADRVGVVSQEHPLDLARMRIQDLDCLDQSFGPSVQQLFGVIMPQAVGIGLVCQSNLINR